LQTGCSSCGFAVPAAAPPDLRPQRPFSRTLTAHVGSSPASRLETTRIERPAVTYSGPPALRDSSELFSAAEPWLTPGAKMLDLGCGPRDQAVAAEHYSLRYVGVDYSSPQADLLADAHSIPFADATFDVVLSYAVLEHLYNPFVAMQEVARVLRPGGALAIVVSQGEPFHDSYFHHTAFGVLSVLQEAHLRPVVMWPSYDTLHALATMGRYPRVLRLLIEAVHRIGKIGLLAPRRLLHWSAREKAVDQVHRAASICFVAEKPALLAT
jgi:SAM-dependent methyltransferase